MSCWADCTLEIFWAQSSYRPNWFCKLWRTWLKRYWLLRKRQCMCDRKLIPGWQKPLSFLSVFSCYERLPSLLAGKVIGIMNNWESIKCQERDGAYYFDLFSLSSINYRKDEKEATWKAENEKSQSWPKVGVLLTPTTVLWKKKRCFLTREGI